MWKQIIDANWRVPYVGGWCLKYVQDAFGTDHPYPNPMDAWNANYGNGNHPNEQPPVGKTVPVYFALGNVPEGHVAISLDDGTVASSTQAGSHAEGYLHPSLQNLIDVYGQYNGGCTYIGWSEYVGTERVLGPEQVNATVAEIQQDYLDILERPADAGALSHYQNYTNDFVRADLLNSAEYRQLQANKAAAAQAALDAQHAAEVQAAAAAAAAAAAQAAVQAAQALADAAAKDAQPIVASPTPAPTPTPKPPVTPVVIPSVYSIPTQATPVVKLNIIQIIIQFITNLIKGIFSKKK